MNKKTVVRVVLHNGDKITPADETIRLWLELLSVAGIVRVHKEDEDHVVFDLYHPSVRYLISQEIWAKQTAEKMQSYGVNAVAAPPYK